MTRDELGRVTYEAWLEAIETHDDDGSAINWEAMMPGQRAVWLETSESVRAAVIAAEFGPHASVVVTAYLAALEAFARAADMLDHPPDALSLVAVGQHYQAMLTELRAYPDWQRKGE